MNNTKARRAFSIFVRCNHRKETPEEQANEEFFVREAIVQLLRVRGHEFTLSAPSTETVDTERERNEWVPMAHRMPTASDADATGCVLVWDRLNGVMTIKWNNTTGLRRQCVTHWTKCPRGPEKEERYDVHAI